VFYGLISTRVALKGLIHFAFKLS